MLRYTLFALSALFLPLAPMLGSYSVVEKRIDSRSPYDMLRYAIQSGTKQAEAIDLFISAASSEKGKRLWETGSEEDKKVINELVFDAMEILLADEYTSGAIAPHKNIPDDAWLRYLQHTDGLKNRTIDPSLDIARTVFLEYEEKKSAYSIFEVALDIIAADVLAQKKPSADETADAINSLLFDDMRIRFPPQKSAHIYIDRFTSMEKILASKRGVCLGVSVIYASILQRIGTPFQIYTPPGHIFLTIPAADRERVIETTARGIHLPIKQYLNCQTEALQKRSPREVAGLVLMNDAACRLESGQYAQTIDLYLKAKKQLPDDPLLAAYTSLAFLLQKEHKNALKYARESLKNSPPHSFDTNSLASDIASSRLDTEGGHLFIMTILGMHQTEKGFDTREAEAHIRKKLDSMPADRRPASLMYLAAHLALSRGDTKEASLHLEYAYDMWSRGDGTFPFGLSELQQLAELSLARSQIPQAVKYTEQALKLVAAKQNFCIDKNGCSIEIPSELEELIAFIAQKSPGSMKIQ